MRHASEPHHDETTFETRAKLIRANGKNRAGSARESTCAFAAQLRQRGLSAILSAVLASEISRGEGPWNGELWNGEPWNGEGDARGG